jgi:branched-chain amino acid transport system ATP-binding protein
MSGDHVTDRVNQSILAVDHLSMRFGGIVAVNDLSFEAGQRQITALIGPNGAGKTTVFNCITGFYKPTGGTMRLTHEGAPAIALERLNDFRISKQAKVARTFQNIRLFPGMTALENLMVAQHNALMLASGLTFLGLIGAPSWRVAEKRAIDLATFWLQRIGLLDRADGRGQPALWRSAPARNCARDVHRTRAALPGRAGRRPQRARKRGLE